MKIKSRAVRRNSSGYRLQEDEPVSANSAVVSDSLVRSDPDDLDVGHSFLVGSRSVSNCVVNEGDQYGDFMDMDDGLVLDHGWDSLGAAPMRMTGGVVINERGSSCEAGANRSQRLPEASHYVGKGKGKVDDAPPLPSHVSYSLGGVAVGRFLDGYRVSTMPPSVSNESAVGTSPVYCNAGPSAQGSVASDAHVPFDVIAPHHEGCLVSDYPFTMPAGVPSADGASSSCYPSFAAAGVSLNSGMPTASAPVPFVEPREEFTVSDVRYTVPLNMASGSSANTSCTGAIGAHQPAAGSGSHDAAPIPTSARACRRPRPRTGPRARERRVPAGSAVPPRNAPGAPFIAGVNCCF